jgi:hypothetical protein
MKGEVCVLKRVPGPETEGVKGGCTELLEELHKLYSSPNIIKGKVVPVLN